MCRKKPNGNVKDQWGGAREKQQVGCLLVQASLVVESPLDPESQLGSVSLFNHTGKLSFRMFVRCFAVVDVADVLCY